MFNLAKEVWSEDSKSDDAMAKHANSMVFPIGTSIMLIKAMGVENPTSGKDFIKNDIEML